VYVVRAGSFLKRGTVTPIRTATNTPLKPVRIGPPLCFPPSRSPPMAASRTWRTPRATP
jgi:hypothetical protein